MHAISPFIRMHEKLISDFHAENIGLLFRKMNRSSRAGYMSVIYLNLISLLLSLLCSGCIATRSVREVGIVYEELNISTIYNAGELVILEAAATRKKDFPRSYDMSRKRFIVGSPALVSKGVFTLDAKFRTEITRRQITPVFVSITANNEKGWHLLPDLIPKDVSSEMIIRRLFEQNSKVDKTKPIQVYPVSAEVPFNIAGVKYSLTFNPTVRFRSQGENAYYQPYDGQGGQTEIHWWHYPLQVLLIPAVVVDVVTFPLQFYYVARDFGHGP